MIHLLFPTSEKLLKTLMPRLLKCNAHTKKNGGTLMDTDEDSVDLQLSNRKL